jgi:hypothetical protein
MRSRRAPAACLALAGLACSQPAATGSFSDVVVVAEREGPGLDTLAAALAAPVSYLGREEPRFLPARASAAWLREALSRKNVLLVATLGASGPLGRRVRSLLAPADRRRVEDSGAGWFLYADVYAGGQVVGVLTARREQGLDSLLARSGPELVEALEESAVVRTERELRRRSRPVQAFRARYGFSIALPPAYARVESPGGWSRAVELVAEDPVRVLGVFWAAGVDSQQAASPEFLTAELRRVLGRLHGDTLVELEALGPSRVGPLPSLSFRGVWQNAREAAGGPFLAHFVYDARRERLYGIHALLFAPGRAKHAYVRELRALIQSFRLEAAA